MYWYTHPSRIWEAEVGGLSDQFHREIVSQKKTNSN